MSMKMMPFNRTCREVAALLVAREDRNLGLADRLALRMHMVFVTHAPDLSARCSPCATACNSGATTPLPTILPKTPYPRNKIRRTAELPA